MAALMAFLISSVLAVIKAVLWILSGSSTVLASLTDSVQDCILSATNFFAVRYAMKEADHHHRYGHGKMEGIVALGQAAFMIGACLFIILESLRNFKMGQAPDYPYHIIAVMGGAILVNFGLVLYQNAVVKRSGSLAIEADKAHYTSDIAIHGGVILAVIIGHMTGWHWVDPVLAVCIAIWMVYLACQIGTKAIDMLMDKELPKAEREAMKTIIQRTRGVMAHHDLRAHRHGQMIMISFDIEVEPSLSFIDAHNIAKRVEDRLHKAYPQSEIMIHVDPCGDITDSRHKKIKKHHVQ